MKTTNGAYIVDSLGKILIAHPHNHAMNLWSVPKGLFDEGETDSKEAAIRETLEETNLNLVLFQNKTTYEDLGIFKYKHKKKQIHGHLFHIDLPLSDMDLYLECKSMYEDPKSGKMFPECDITKWSDYEFASLNLHYTQRKFLQKIEHLLV
jgi:8-oxo-dGTP pyrophosphatase MutT (NUDIX family)